MGGGEGLGKLRYPALDFRNLPRDTLVQKLKDWGFPVDKGPRRMRRGLLFYGNTFSPQPSITPEGLRSIFFWIT